MRAINVIDQMRELVARNRLLIMLEYFPLRFVAEDADGVRRLNARCKDRRQ